MKQIKFRGKRTDNNQWVYGDYTYDPRPTGKPDESGHTILSYPKGYECNAYDVIPATVGQFIGAKDKNDKDIYEGDRVKFHLFRIGSDGQEKDYENVGIIEYNNSRCEFQIVVKKTLYAEVVYVISETSHLEEPCLEIIGNIYENANEVKQ